jgi:hypothetical protein
MFGIGYWVKLQFGLGTGLFALFVVTFGYLWQRIREE